MIENLSKHYELFQVPKYPMRHSWLARGKKLAFADVCRLDKPPVSGMAGQGKPQLLGTLRRCFLGWGHALEWMSLGPARGLPQDPDDLARSEHAHGLGCWAGWQGLPGRGVM